MVNDEAKHRAVEVAAQRLAARTPPNKHGQLCPIWTRRAKNPPITACDCWVLADARTDARVVVLAVWSSAEDAALRTVGARMAEPRTEAVDAVTAAFRGLARSPDGGPNPSAVWIDAGAREAVEVLWPLAERDAGVKSLRDEMNSSSGNAPPDVADV